jgi:beta-barrel assembly-enhancing protease
MLYEMLVQAATKAGDQTSVDRYRAEKLYAEGDLEPAIRHLELACGGLVSHTTMPLRSRFGSMRCVKKNATRSVAAAIRCAPPARVSDEVRSKS